MVGTKPVRRVYEKDLFESREPGAKMLLVELLRWKKSFLGRL